MLGPGPSGAKLGEPCIEPAFRSVSDRKSSRKMRLPARGVLLFAAERDDYAPAHLVHGSKGSFMQKPR